MDLIQWFTSFFKKTSSGTSPTQSSIFQQSAEKIRKPIIRTLKKRKVYSSSTDSIWITDLGNMRLIKVH